MNVLKFIFILLLLTNLNGCKKYQEILIEVKNGEVIFILPQLLENGTLDVEEFNKESIGENKWHIVWTISFSKNIKESDNKRLIYGKTPESLKIEVVSKPKPLKVDTLYSVGINIGSVVAKGYFILNMDGTKLKVKNLNQQEIKDFYLSN